MSEIIQPFKVRLGPKHRAPTLRLCFDTGSPATFIARDAAARVGHLMELGEPKEFGGLGNGRFLSRDLCHAEVRLLKYWCAWAMYVVDGPMFRDRFDVLVGHDFMRKYGVECVPRRRALRFDERSLDLSQIVL